MKKLDKDIAFCEICLDYKEYDIKNECVVKHVRGHDIEYVESSAYCKSCGSMVYVPEINDNNLKKWSDKLREIDNIISVEEIKEITKKYSIAKRPLSKLLGWGEITVSRYIDGKLPTRDYSDKLKLILNNVYEMEKLLENNKSNINDIAYKKCRDAIDKLIDERALSLECDCSKIDKIANYIIYMCEDITPLALQKLLYYSQAFCRIFTGKFLFEDDCQAWVHGPVYTNIYNKFSEFGGNVIFNEYSQSYENGPIYLDDQNEQEVVDCVIKYFGMYSGKTLELMTHMERPWRETRSGLKENEISNRVIEKKMIESYFTLEKEKYNMINVSDIKEYVDCLLKRMSFL